MTESVVTGPIPTPPSSDDIDLGARRVAARRRNAVRWVGALLLLGVLVGGLAIALAHEPPFYGERILAEAGAEQHELSRKFINKTTRLIGDVQNGRPWRDAFDERTLNAWLADDFDRNYADQLLPSYVDDPRVQVEERTLRVGFRVKRGPASAVVQLRLGCWAPRPNLVAIELYDSSVGLVPLPASYTRQMVERIAHTYKLDVTWKRRGTNLVALLELPRGSRSVALQRVEIADGKLNIAGLGTLSVPATDFAPSAN